MRTITKPNGPVFHPGPFDSNTLTRREYFAALALQGLLSDYRNNSPPGSMAQAAVLCADALIEELNK